MTDFLDNVRGDLAVLRRIAARPAAENPLLALILAQAQSLAEIGQWAANVEAGWPSAAVGNADEAEAEVIDIPQSVGNARP